MKTRDGVASGFVGRTRCSVPFLLGMPVFSFHHHPGFQRVGRGGWEGRKEGEERREESGVPPGDHCPDMAIRHLKYD